MPSWGPYLPLDDAPDPEYAMEHSGQGFITKELMIGMTTTESYNDFNAADIQVIFLNFVVYASFGTAASLYKRMSKSLIQEVYNFQTTEF